MPRFGKKLNFNEQAKKIVLKVQNYNNLNGSVRTYDHHIANLTKIGRWSHENYNIKHLDQVSHTMVNEYLSERSTIVSQSMLDQERNSLSVLTRRESSKLYNKEIKFVVSEKVSIKNCRIFTREQINLIKQNQSLKNAISTEIAFISGVRAHELLTIRKKEEQPPSNRNWNKDIYKGRNNFVAYSVTGKGGLVREIRLPKSLSTQLENFRSKKK